MKSNLCEIYFPNNPSRVFYSGEILSGLVVIKLTKPKTVKGIYIRIFGRAYCRWTSGSGHHCKSHVGEEFYLNEKTFFVGDDSGEVLLTPKQYNYTFSCKLPSALPTSVEGNIGYIRYSLAVHIDNTLWSIQRFQEYFTVIKPLNLNDEIVLRNPFVKEERKTFVTCCLLLCCKSGPLVMSGSVPVRGYVPGQTIDLLLQINNRSDQSIQNFNIQIIKQIQYYTHANSSTTQCDKIVVKSATCNGCSKNQFKTYTVSVTVPPLPPTDESTSNIIKVSYRLQIQGSAGCFHEDPVLSFPIKIGTYPILLNNTSPDRLPTTVSSQESSSVPSPSIISPENSNSVDPPTYEEATSGYLDNGSESTFRPSYPVFRRTPSYTIKCNP